jgi:HEAT repeat protein
MVRRILSNKLPSYCTQILICIALITVPLTFRLLAGESALDNNLTWAQRLADKNPSTRREALLELGTSDASYHLAEVLPYILKGLGDKDASVRFTSHSALYYVMAKSAEKSPSEYRNALQIIEASADQLKEGALDNDPKIREAALMNLGLFVPPNAEISQIVILSLKDTNYKVRARAAELAIKTGPLTPEVMPSLIEAVHDENEVVRLSAVHTLGVLKRPEAIMPLLDVAKDRNNALRRDALMALARIGALPQDAVQVLQVMSEDTREDEAVRLDVIHLLRRTIRASPELARAAIVLLGSQKAEIRRGAVGEISEMGSSASEALPTLDRLSETDPDERLRELAKGASEQIRGGGDNQPAR